VPQGNLVALKNVEDGGKGSKLTRTVTVKLVAEEVSPGSCPYGTITPTPVNLTIVDDDGDYVINASKNASCEFGTTTHIKFGVKYEGPENCKDSAVPTGQVSKGYLFVTASANGGTLDDTLGIQCKK